VQSVRMRILMRSYSITYRQKKDEDENLCAYLQWNKHKEGTKTTFFKMVKHVLTTETLIYDLISPFFKSGYYVSISASVL